MREAGAGLLQRLCVRGLSCTEISCERNFFFFPADELNQYLPLLDTLRQTRTVFNHTFGCSYVADPLVPAVNVRQFP
jgi:hypothetical protein